MTRADKAPFPYFGGKSRAADAVWRALGDCEHYVEPFAGSLAVLLKRPHEENRAYHSETVNDSDGLLVNFWRAVQSDPESVARHASWPVSEVDVMARQFEIVDWISDVGPEVLRADYAACDHRIAGWWVWGLACSIGSGWCGGGPWVREDGRVVRSPARERGVGRKIPSLGDDGSGVNSPPARERGVGRKIPSLGDDGRGVNSPRERERGVGETVSFSDVDAWFHAHPVTMPRLTAWLAALQARLRHVRIMQGDWTRALTDSVVRTLSVRMGGGVSGVFLDPPYGAEATRATVYRNDSHTVAHKVNEWCAARTDAKDVRIVLAGYEGEHANLVDAGWRVVRWFEGGGMLTGGLGSQQHRERLFLSPSCLGDHVPTPQLDLFGTEAT